MPRAHLAEEDGPARGQEDGDRGEEEDGAGEKQDSARREDVEDPLHHGEKHREERQERSIDGISSGWPLA